ncbi:MAG: restriction endonuclease [Bacteroidetes bacterium]|nr:restriction endonuclease [Bacteroidota bacterium]
MSKTKNRITVSEHQSIQVGYESNDGHFEKHHLDALQAFYGKGVPYFTLINNGVKFNEFVGVLQVGGLTIEVLPKTDNGENQRWQELLVGMLRAIGHLDVYAPSSSALSLKPNSILDLYFELFLAEVESLLHTGLTKKYRKAEGNQSALRGAIQFGKQVQRNLVHQERFYITYTVYNKENKLNQILYKTLQLLSRINTNVLLSSRISSALIDFPELSDIKVNAELFDRIVYTRKTESYRRAIEIARLLLLHYHPDLRRGRNDVLALMFDMNFLWERFVYKSLWKHPHENQTIEAQTSKDFWKPKSGWNVRMKPDIVINKDKENCIVLDTKWKNLNGYNPSPEDLRQMFAYSHYYGAKRTMLIYPGEETKTSPGQYFDSEGNLSDRECIVVQIAVKNNITQWQESIAAIVNSNSPTQSLHENIAR